jgi:MFS family permease
MLTVVWGSAFRALRHPNYRLYFAGQIVSLVGTWMTSTATVWLVYRLSGSPFLLGVVGFAGQIPAAVLTPVAGVYIDRWNKHRVLIATQVASMLQSFALAAMVFSGHASIPALVALNVLQGVINAFEMPCRQSFVISLIEDKNDLGNAIALNSSMFNAARLLGPALGGVVIAAAGEGWCYLIDGVSFLAVLVSLLLMRVTPTVPAPRGAGPWALFREGWRYAFDSPPLRSLLLLLAVSSLVGAPYTVLMPVFAKSILGGGPHTLGFLMGAGGAGALAAALALAARTSVRGLTGLVPRAGAVFGVGLILFSFSRSVPGLGPLDLFGRRRVHDPGGGQQHHPSNHRGRRQAGTRAEPIRPVVPGHRALRQFVRGRPGRPLRRALRPAEWAGSAVLAGALWFVRRMPEVRRAIRPIYMKLGILPSPPDR